MKIIVVYGCPCSGKTTYTSGQLKENDLVFDYDALAGAMTHADGPRLEKCAAHRIIMEVRDALIRLAKEQREGTLYITTRWPSRYLRHSLAGTEREYKFIDVPYGEVIGHLENDDKRQDKDGWKKVIDKWFAEFKTDTGGQEMKEIRVAEIRTAAPAGAGNLVLCGRPIVFDAPAVIHDPAGEYTEIIKSGALDGADLSDIRLLYNHDLNKVPLARTPKTMQLTVDPAGLSFTAALPDTAEARAVYEAVKRGDLTGMSFAFKVPKGGDTYDPRTNTRTITRIEKVLECSVVPFPAYPATSVEARSAQDAGLKRLALKKSAKILYNQIMKERIWT